MKRVFWLAGVACALASCTEDASGPGVCPQYCPASSIAVVDTVLPAIFGDTAYGRPIGYANASASPYLLLDSLPGVRDSRAVLRFGAIDTRPLIGTDTTTGPLVGIDSLKLRLTITQRDTATRNLQLALYLLPVTVDSTTSYSDLSGPFGGVPFRTVNVDTLLAQPGARDTVTGDSVAVDSVTHNIVLILRLDSAQVPFSAADTGKVAVGIRVRADTQPRVRLAACEFSGLGPALFWYVKADSLGTVVHPLRQAISTCAAAGGFDSFVFDPPPQPLDATLAVGGVPSTRSVLRIALPRVIRDSSQVVRATLDLLPAVAPFGVAADSFGLVAHAVLADFGAKSALDLSHADTARVRVGTTDTVHVEITNLLRYWASDTTKPTTLVLRQSPEGADFAEIRFFSSRDAVRRPVLHLTYIPRFQFGKP